MTVYRVYDKGYDNILKGMKKMIEVKGLTKKYGNHTAVSNLSFTIEEDQVYGFLGPNGAGKSTTMNIITGCLSATDGTVAIDGLDIYENAVDAKKHIGYLPEIPPLYMDMTPMEYLEFIAEVKKVEKSERKTQIEEAMIETGIKNVENRLIKNLSKGYRQRVGIAQALVGNPSVIILDEPTVGLDPKQIIEIRELIKNLGKKHTVILSSHILSEVQAVCDKILIISNGKLVACDTPENLESLFAGTKTIKLTVKGDSGNIDPILNNIPEIRNIRYKNNGEKTMVEITTDKESDIAEEIFFAFADARMPILRMTEETATLEDIFLELTSIDKDVDIETENTDDESVSEEYEDHEEYNEESEEPVKEEEAEDNDGNI